MQARRDVRPLPDDLFAVEKERVGGGAHRRGARRLAVVRLELGADEAAASPARP